MAQIREGEPDDRDHRGPRGVESIYVEASVNTVSFYRRVGYEWVGTHEKPISVDGTSVEMKMVDMEKELR